VIISFLALLAVTAADPPSTQTKPPPDKRVCVKFPPPTGTRLGERKICKTQAQWDQEQFENKQAIQKIQVNRGLNGI
jgi:hypothetical protein